ncbi:MAG: S-adenosylmethionine/arginine decarboxylase-like enzyme, partial [Glaciecola sp.]
HNYAAVDLFTCSDQMDYEKALEYLKEKFCCSNLNYQVIKRGSNVINKAPKLNSIKHAYEGTAGKS